MAGPGCGTGKIPAQPYGVRRGSHIADSGNAAFHVCDDLIHADYENDMARALDQTCDAVAVAVDVDQLAV